MSILVYHKEVQPLEEETYNFHLKETIKLKGFTKSFHKTALFRYVLQKETLVNFTEEAFS